MKRNRYQNCWPERHGAPWESWEVSRFVSSVAKGKSFVTIANEHKRSIRAIELAAERFCGVNKYGVIKNTLVINKVDYNDLLDKAKQIVRLRIDIVSAVGLHSRKSSKLAKLHTV